MQPWNAGMQGELSIRILEIYEWLAYFARCTQWVF